MKNRSAFLLRSRPAQGWLLAAAIMMAPVVPQLSYALEELHEDDLRDTSGAGISFPFENLRLQMGNTSFIELTGNDPAPGTSFLRGDARYYGMTISRGATRNGDGSYSIYNTGVSDFTGGACTPGVYGLGCARSSEGVMNFSTFDNPYVLRVFDYAGYQPNNTNTTQTVLELLGPSNTDPFRWAFWGEIEAGRTVDGNGNRTGASCGVGTSAPGANNDCILQSQSIILGKPATYQKSFTRAGTTNNPMMGQVLRLFQFQGAAAGQETLGIIYASRLSGDYRFSVNKAAATQFGVVPDFTDEEGMYFRDVHAYLPLGQQNYQAITLNNVPGATATNGNFVVELAAIPDQPNVYNDFYSMAPALLRDSGCVATLCTSAYQESSRGYIRTVASLPGRYFDTHGYVSWGDKFPTNGNPNGMGGTGVSSQRFSGTGDGLAATVTLPALAVTATNFTGNLCKDGVGAWSSCEVWTGGTAPAVTVNMAAGRVTATGTKGDILAAGGISFVSRSGGSWQVLNNQNLPGTSTPSQSVSALQNNLDVKRARTNNARLNCTWYGDCEKTLSPRPTPDTATIQDRANTLFAYPANYNPLLTVDSINLGSARIEGLQINHMKITSLGANN
ncbi:MAG: hypothetical protein IT466_05430 [Moraxellaceae bacterium]|nr:hypothetical protein [Moraxellaceae bacterium]